MTQPSHTAFITGASSGIGAIYAERLAARGYNLILAARREDRLLALADQLQARYAIQASILKADLSEEHGIAAVEQRLQQDPAIDLFINNAGTAKMAGFLASTPREHQVIHTLNTTALLRLSYAALAASSHDAGERSLILPPSSRYIRCQVARSTAPVKPGC